MSFFSFALAHAQYDLKSLQNSVRRFAFESHFALSEASSVRAAPLVSDEPPSLGMKPGPFCAD